MTQSSASKLVLDWGELPSRLVSIKRPLVFTNGCFDILHRGHVAYLEEAAQLGQSLIVGLNSDASVKRLDKSNDIDRPINPLADRLAVLAALACVNLVVAFEQDTPFELIERVKPDYLVKGGDWPTDQIVGKDFVESNGGSVVSIPFRYQRSTTALIKRIRGD